MSTGNVHTCTWKTLSLAVAALCLFRGCVGLTQTAGGGGTETVIGRVVHADGRAAPATVVELFPYDYDPVAHSGSGLERVTVTDDSGRYAFKGLDTGTYTLQAINVDRKTRALKSGLRAAGRLLPLLVDTLRRPGAVKVVFVEPVDTDNGYVYVPGTDISVPLAGAAGQVTMVPVPSGTIPAVNYAVADGGGGMRRLAAPVQVPENDTVIISYGAWQYARRLYLNTTSSGANVQENVRAFPVLVRLSRPVLDFNQADVTGADIRFSRPDNAPLPYEIERWDASAGQAEIWVRVDTIYGSNSTQFISMHWGNSAATDASNSAVVFDTAAGFQGVWHLAGAGDTDALDATRNRFNGTPYHMSAVSAVTGAIGTARRFDGDSSCIKMAGTADSKLNFPQRGNYTLSAWVNAAALEDTAQDRPIVSKGDFQYHLQVHARDQVFYWEFAEYQWNKSWEFEQAPAIAQTWKFITGVRSGSSMLFYVDGVCVRTSPDTVWSTYSRNTSFDLALGIEQAHPSKAFNGIIDEVRVSSAARGSAWIRLCYMNQKAQDALVEFR
jgi:hypothetical protein